MVTANRERELSDAQIAEMVDFLCKEFLNDPITVRWFGSTFAENSEVRKAAYENDVRKGLAVGRIHTVRAESPSKELLALSVSFSPGRDASEVPTMRRLQDLTDAFPAEQKAFRQEFDRKQKLDSDAVYPLDFKKREMYVWHLGVRGDSRRKGYGKALLEQIIKEAEGEGAKTVLDTSAAENIVFYATCGLRLFSSFEISHYRFGPLPKMYTFATGV